MKVAFFLLLSFALAQTSVNRAIPETAGRMIKSADLREDLAVLRRAYEKLHPGLYRYSDKVTMDARFESLSGQFGRDLSLEEAYLAFSVFAAQVKCGHTYANFFNQRKEIAAALFQGHNRVPFYFRWLNSEMVITKDLTKDQSLPRGTRVLSINGAPSQVILNRLKTIARADGSNDVKRIAYLEVTGDSIYEAFDVYFPMFFPQKSTGMRITAQRPGELEPKSFMGESLTFEERTAPIQARDKARSNGEDVPFEWKFLQDGAAYLKMPTWALYNMKWDWKTWLNSRLDELSGKVGADLIVDLRGNEGGNDVGNEILKRLVRTDLKVSRYQPLVRYRRTPTDLNPYLDTWDASFRNWGAAAVELSEAWTTAPPVRFYALVRSDDRSGEETIHPSGRPLGGRLYVLIDGSNSSATFQFAQTVQQNKLGKLVGQPTGGNQRGINGGAFFFLRLPKSQIEMDLPIIGNFPVSPQPDAGLIPDLVVTPTLQDIADGLDVEIAAMEVLRRSERN